MAHPFIEAIRERVLLADGATGTELHARGWRGHGPLAAIEDRDRVRALHEEYLRAGADLILTDTFEATRIQLARHGYGDRVRDVNFQAARIARDAREIIGAPAFIGGSISPFGRDLAVGSVTPEQAGEAVREQAGALVEGGVDLIVLETFPSLLEVRIALEAVRAVTDLPVIAALDFVSALTTPAGESPSEVARLLAGPGGADVVGVNCGVGPRATLDILQELAAAGIEAPLFVKPNAGLPRITGGQPLYPSSPDYFANFVLRAKDLSAAVVGGCCGSTPAHIRAMREALDGAGADPNGGADEASEDSTSLAVSDTRGGVRDIEVEAQPASWHFSLPQPTVTRTGGPEEQTGARLRDKLAAGSYVVSVEIDPPRGINPRKAVEGARLLHEAGADAINIGDSPMARVRMSALALAVEVQREAGIETIIHQTTRDRNLMALQADLLGAHALGVRNVIALTGDPPPEASQSSAVWDVDAIGFIRILKRLNEGVDVAGNSLGRPTDFFVACAANPTAGDVPIELSRVRAKLDAGADLLMTQPVYDLATIEEFFERLGTIDVPVLLGILPLMSSRHAEFIHNELEGVVVPDAIRERMRAAGEAGADAGLEVAAEQIEEARGLPWVSGVYVMPSFGRYEVAAALVRQIRSA